MSVYLITVVRLTVLSTSLLLGACASVGVGSSDLPFRVENWMLVPSDDPAVVVVQRNLANGLVSMMCTEGDCETLLIGNQACEISEPFPILLNTALETSLTQGGCAQAEEIGSGQRINSVVFLNESNLLVPSIVLGDEASFAVPMINGNIILYVVPTAGLRAILAPLLPRIFSAPPWLNEPENEPETEPLPENGNSDRDLLI